MFGQANAGGRLSSLGTVIWLIFAALLFGKWCGISAASFLGVKLGFPLPEGMNLSTCRRSGDLTVSLFIAGQAFSDPVLQEEAKMGALLSIGISIVAMVAGRITGIRKRHKIGGT